MLFPTGEFAIFFLVSFFLCWISSKYLVLNKIILLALSYLFYSWWDFRFSFLLAGSSFANYSFAIFLDNTSLVKRRKLILVLAVISNLMLLSYFKYFGFFLSSFADILGYLGLNREIKIFEVILPVGISFFTFQGISYVVDVYKKEIKAAESPIDVLLYNSFFPHLVAGPIVRAKDFIPQLSRKINYEEIPVTRAFILIGLGLFKKVVLAHVLAVEVVGPAFEAPQTFRTIDLLLGVYSYAFQIYFDFSAYSDLAIGIAYLLGFEFKRNFDQPYRASSLSDFWRRWHISLSSFLRDYLYIPLGGSKKSTFHTYRNLVLTMLLGGLWHGASWNFVLWGLVHGLGLVCEKEISRRRLSLSVKGLPGIFRNIITFNFICFCWIFFNSETLRIAFDYLVSFGNVGFNSSLITIQVLLVWIICIVSQSFPKDYLSILEDRIGKAPVFFQGALLGYWTVFISALSPGVLSPFIYFKF